MYRLACKVSVPFPSQFYGIRILDLNGGLGRTRWSSRRGIFVHSEQPYGTQHRQRTFEQPRLTVRSRHADPFPSYFKL